MASEDVSNVHAGQQAKPCRTCTDFKSWSKLQRKAMNEKNSSNDSKSFEKQEHVRDNMLNEHENSLNDYDPDKKHCPLDSVHLGRKTWGLLHTMAARYPERPTENQQSHMKTFLSSLSQLYPCDECAKDFQVEMKNNPPLVTNQNELSQWMCRLHNAVNVKLNKPKFDCTKVNERWRDGWLDGSCD